MSRYTEKTGGLPLLPPAPAPNLRLADQTGEHQESQGIPTATPGINQHKPLGRLISFQKKIEQ
jgi:hypothetical protein